MLPNGDLTVLTGPLSLRHAPPPSVLSSMPAAVTQSLSELKKAIVGTATPRTPDLMELNQWLADAREREARFDSAGANALRQQVLAAFADCLHTNPELRQVAVTAQLDLVASQLGEDKTPAAELLARNLVRRFGRPHLDPARYPPAVRTLFDTTAQEAARAPTMEVRVKSHRPGTVYADGRLLGPIQNNARFRLQRGDYRLWLVDEQGQSSLPRVIDIEDQPVDITLSIELDERLLIEDSVLLRCDDDCDTQLAALALRIGVPKVLGLPYRPEGLDPQASQVDNNAALSLTTPVSARPQFTPWYLVPFGVGQFAGDQPLLGGGIAAAEVGLLAWHLFAIRAHSQAVNDNHYADEPALREQRNLSATWFYGSLVAGVVEAVVMGLVTGE